MYGLRYTLMENGTLRMELVTEIRLDQSKTGTQVRGQKKGPTRSCPSKPFLFFLFF